MHSSVLFLFATCLPPVWLMDLKALDEFVNLPDPHYEYTFLKRKTNQFFVRIVNTDLINMTSQKWLNESEVDKPIWCHNLTICVPKVPRIVDSCLLIIRDGGNNSPDPIQMAKSTIKAIETKSVVALLKQLPAQPLTFYDHPLGHKNITGFNIFAYSWWKFINDPTAPPDQLAQFPMVKAVVRAMDTIVHYMKKEYHRDIRRFTLMGVYSSGWIAWLTAAVDKRVEAITTIGMDFLNFNESFHHQYRAYCGWSYLLRSFYEMNITQELDNPRFSELASHVDPMAYSDRYKEKAKYIVVFSGDEFSLPDNSHYYMSQLEGVKYLQIIPNVDYQVQRELKYLNRILVFYAELINKKLGSYRVSWEITMTNTSAIITVVAYNVYRVYSHHADTVDSTRKEMFIGKKCKYQKKDGVASSFRTAEVYLQEKMLNGIAISSQVLYPDYGGSLRFTATSEMAILPDTYPCPDCNEEECHGTLV
ncbi:autocrine proliferation repressor protein A-like [Heteronotia binoei]|uniref:autocrine proliferation repressor protein A-like n=1 Tax=Heteronotia binoei TaxID=13085 RepID=UPI002930420A|nr:autocrine proliferation repressor protein A-like [Heteronotia binoei]